MDHQGFLLEGHLEPLVAHRVRQVIALDLLIVAVYMCLHVIIRTASWSSWIPGWRSSDSKWGVRSFWQALG